MPVVWIWRWNYLSSLCISSRQSAAAKRQYPVGRVEREAAGVLIEQEVGYSLDS